MLLTEATSLVTPINKSLCLTSNWAVTFANLLRFSSNRNVYFLFVCLLAKCNEFFTIL
ncbi:hypothetical protein PUND_a1711 [Pseudoalteromonas undina]|nr:hypothetical protein PUND_a1711 [Pseudoalteromonas undina]